MVLHLAGHSYGSFGTVDPGWQKDPVLTNYCSATPVWPMRTMWIWRVEPQSAQSWYGGEVMRQWRAWAAMTVIGLLGHGSSVGAQSLPAGAPPGMIPEPVPSGPAYPPPGYGGGGGLVPGPISPYAAPPGPDGGVSLPANSPGAFIENPYEQEKRIFVHIGALGLQLGSVAPIPLSYNVPGNVDNGTPIPYDATPNYSYNVISPNMNWGVIGTLGCLIDNQQFEVTGFYLPEKTSSASITSAGQLNVPYIGVPLGLSGNNGVGLQADTISISQSVAMGNLEGNYRMTGLAHREFDLILGVRYFDYQQGTTFFTDDGSVLNNLGQANPLLQTNYLTNTYNRMVGPQIGLEYATRILYGFSFTSEAKTAFMANFMERNMSLSRGDGFNIFTRNKTNTGYSQLFQMGFNLEWNMFEKFKVRGGYNLLWLVGVAQSADLIDFNITNPVVNTNTGSNFFQGPSIEFHFLF